MRMGPANQLVAAISSPLALLRLPRRTWGFFFLYLGLCALVLGGAAHVVFHSEDAIRQLLLAYLFPDAWHDALGMVADRFLEKQSRLVIANTAVIASLGLVALLLFPIKEMLSVSFEREAKLITDPEEEHPLWEQAWEEIKLFLGVLAIQGTVFWIGYHGGETRAAIAVVLGNVLTFAVYAIDFISPPMQRHYGHYSRILKTLATHPIASLGFGAIFAAPALLATALVDTSRLETLVAITCLINVIGIAWAAVAGTWLGAKLYPDFVQTKRSAIPTRILTWLLVGGLFVANAYAFGSLAWSVHKKSQILKCRYAVDWSSFELERPGLTSLLKNKATVGVSFVVTIENPTSVPVELEKNTIELRHEGAPLGTASLRPFRVEPRQIERQRVGATLTLSPTDVAKKNTALLDRDKWAIELIIEVAPGFDFPVTLLE